MVDALARDGEAFARVPHESPISPHAPELNRVRAVLVVDDDEVIRRLVRDGLEREGLRVRDAADSTEALDEIEEHPPLLVILDVNLGPIGGFDVLSRIRAVSRVPVILLT